MLTYMNEERVLGYVVCVYLYTYMYQSECVCTERGEER